MKKSFAQVLGCTVLAAALCTPALAVAAEEPEAAHTRPKSGLLVLDETDVEPEPESRVDRFHRAVSRGLRRTGAWADSFFGNERYDAESNETRLRLRVDTFVEEGEGVGGDVAASLRLHLPETSERLSFVAEGGADESNTIQNTRTDDIRQEFRGTGDRNISLGLKYKFVSHDYRAVIGQVGVRFRDIDPAAALGGRYRELIAWADWAIRFTQQVLWFSDNGFETITTLDFDRVLTEHLFFRQTLEGSWFEDETGYFYAVNTSLIQPWTASTAAEYQLLTEFQTVPSHRLEEWILRLRIRHHTQREWLVLEIAPQVSFPRERDFEPTPGILFRTELSFNE